MVSGLEKSKERMRNALTALGDGYHTRDDIAEQLGKKQLNPLDKEALEQLEISGEIEKLLVSTIKPHIFKSAVRLTVKEGSK